MSNFGRLSKPPALEISRTVAGQGIQPGMFYQFSERYFRACKALKEFEDFVMSSPLTIQDFDEAEILESFYTESKKGKRRAAPHKALTKIISSKTDVDKVIREYRRTAPEDLKHLARAIVNISACHQLLEVLTTEELRHAAERYRESFMRSFEAETLYKNPFFAPEVSAFAISRESVVTGMSSGGLSSLKIARVSNDAMNISQRLTERYPRLQRGTQPVDPSPKVPSSPLVREIVAEYDSLVESLPVIIRDFDEEALTKEAMSHVSPYIRTYKNILRIIRHQYTNYDRLYFSDEVRSRKYWHLTGYLASRKAIYLHLEKVIQADALKNLIHKDILNMDARLLSTAKHAARHKNTEQFLRERYIAEVTSGVKNEKLREEAISYT